jgi:hypothetical protein
MKAGTYIGQDGRTYLWIYDKEVPFSSSTTGYRVRCVSEDDGWYYSHIMPEDWPAAKSALDALIAKEAGADIKTQMGAYVGDLAVQRFWAKVSLPEDLDACWEWIGAEFGKGYGGFWLENDWWRAHRAAWYMFNGPIPDGMMVCHKCDNRKCVNPKHLFLGSASDNAQDCTTKGRNPSQAQPEKLARGERCGAAKLTEGDVVDIRQRYAVGNVSQRQLAADYGVDQGTIKHAIRGTTWAHVPMPSDDGEWVEWDVDNFHYQALTDGSVIQWKSGPSWTPANEFEQAAYRKGREVALEQVQELASTVLNSPTARIGAEQPEFFEWLRSIYALAKAVKP